MKNSKDNDTLKELIKNSPLFIQGYRPGAIEQLGFGAEAAARIRPGIIYISLSAYGHLGPWTRRRGFDSLVQTATGFNQAEAVAASSPQPKALPIQILDHASGYLIALAAQVALMKQLNEGGSWHVRVSLSQTAKWLRTLGRLKNGIQVLESEGADFLDTSESGFGKLVAISQSARFSMTPAIWSRPSMPPGTHPAKLPPSQIST